MKLNILVTAGPTREALDPVRYISNNSSGTMGYAIAKEAVSRHHKVTLISGPVALPAVSGARLVNIEAARELSTALKKNLKQADVLIMAAAVCDFKPQKFLSQKIKRQDKLSLRLTKTPDILSELKNFKRNRVFVGFALESRQVLANASAKLKAKGLDLIVANEVKKSLSPFGPGKTTVWFCDKNGSAAKLNNIAKSKLAKHLLDRVEELCYFKQLP